MCRRQIVVAFLVSILAALAIACGEKEQATNDRVELPLEDAAAMFEEDLRHSFEGSYFVEYELKVEVEGVSHECMVKWWKDGTERQRFDMCAPLLFGEDWGGEPWRVLMFGDRDQILVCSSKLPLDSSEEELDEDGPGACHEDSSGIGDLAGNAVFYLDFPLEYPDALPPGYFDSVDEVEFRETWSEEIAGREARCYAITVPEEEKERDVTTCYADNGAEVRSSGDYFFDYKLDAIEVGSIDSSVFDVPYQYVDAAID